MKNCFVYFYLFFQFVLIKSYGLVGSTSFEVQGGNSTNPTYYIASAPLSSDVVFTGQVSGFDNTNGYISFDIETNSSGATSYPFHGDNVFVPGVQIPEISISVTSGQVNTPTVTWNPGTFKSNKPGFTEAPEIVLYDADFNQSAELNATIASGQLTGVTIVDAGQGYTSAPKVRVVAGPHFVKITDSASNYKGRVFLISDNNKTRLNLDMSRLANGESSNVSTYFPVGTLVEVIPATTLGGLFGTDISELPTNWTYGLPDATDWIYIWDVETWTYQPYFFNGTDYESSSNGSWGRGWYSKLNPSNGILNHTVLYPDEAFLVAKRTSGNVTIEFEGEIDTSDKQLLLPQSGNQILAKNPYGADMMLCELIPSTAITTNSGSSSLFRSGTDETGDVVTFLEGAVWKQYYYDASYGNNAVTVMHQLGVRRPLDGSDNNASTMDANDFYIGNGSVTNIESCDATGQTGQSDESYSKLTISGSSSDLKGFTITFSNLQGYLLYENGPEEANASTGNQVTSPNRGSIIDSNLNGSFEIVKSGSGFVVIEKQRDVNFKSDEGTPVWKIGNLGTGYSRNANFYCIGGNGVTDSNATGTIATNGTVTVSSNGANYNSAPHAIVSGGGWRYQSSAGSRDNQILGASSGLLIQRNSSSGTKSFIQSLNPFE